MMKKDINCIKLFYFFVCLTVLFIAPVLRVFGSSESIKVKFQFSPESVGVGEQVKVSVIITAYESLNAIEGVVVIPTEIAKIEKILDASAGVSLWINRPRLKENNKIEFSGITPGGFTGQDVVLFSFILKGTGRGVGQIKFETLEALKNDENGTPVLADETNSKIEVVDRGAEKYSFMPIVDTVPPESFKPILSKAKGLFSDDYFVSFDTTDKTSGIDYFEASEKPILFPLSTWHKVKSPYIIGNLSIYESLKIKAVDMYGNERVETISLTALAFKRVFEWSILLLVVTLCFKIVWLRYRKINMR